MDMEQCLLIAAFALQRFIFDFLRLLHHCVRGTAFTLVAFGLVLHQFYGIWIEVKVWIGKE